MYHLMFFFDLKLKVLPLGSEMNNTIRRKRTFSLHEQKVKKKKRRKKKSEKKELINFKLDVKS